MALKGRISPVRNTSFAHPSPFLLGLLTPILSVRSVVLLRLCQEALCSTGQQEAEGPLRRCRGRHLLPSLYRQMRVMVVLCGLHCAHTSSVYFLHNLDYCYWFMTAGHVLRCVGRAPELKNKTKEKAISLSLLWQWMRVAPEKLATLSSAFTFNWDITHWLTIKPFQWRLWVWPFHCAADPNRKAFWVHT